MSSLIRVKTSDIRMEKINSNLYGALLIFDHKNYRIGAKISKSCKYVTPCWDSKITHGISGSYGHFVLQAASKC